MSNTEIRTAQCLPHEHSRHVEYAVDLSDNAVPERAVIAQCYHADSGQLTRSYVSDIFVAEHGRYQSMLAHEVQTLRIDGREYRVGDRIVDQEAIEDFVPAESTHTFSGEGSQLGLVCLDHSIAVYARTEVSAYPMSQIHNVTVCIPGRVD